MRLKPFKRVVAEVSGLANATIASYRSKRTEEYSTDIDSLRERFNRDKGKVRLLALLSPTCGFCLSGASVVQRLLKKLNNVDIEVYSVWVPILASDANFTVSRATNRLSDSGVSHYWDSEGVLVKAFAGVLGLGDHRRGMFTCSMMDPQNGSMSLRNQSFGKSSLEFLMKPGLMAIGWLQKFRS